MYASEAGYIQKFLDELDPVPPGERNYKNPPPLYKKELPEGGLVPWVSVAAWYVSG
jgi:hypothetical protein